MPALLTSDGMADPVNNVYRGPSAVQAYFDPGQTPPLPLVELPAALNPFRADGVRVYAKLMTMHPANNVKAMPALNLLEKCVVPGRTRRVIEYSSGSTVISMALVSRVFHADSVTECCAYLSNKTSEAKVRLMQFFGLNITLFGGPSQPEPTDERGGIRAAARAAQISEGSTVNPDQYANDDNWGAHVRWTGPQIARQLPEINVICAGLGTSGTMTGLGTYFKDTKPDVYRLGVVTAAGDRVPGPRSYALLAPVEFPWRKAVDHLEHVGSHDSFALSLQLTREGIVCGPSSGFNLRGLYQFLEKRKAEGTLKQLSGPDNEIHCVFLACDLPYQYISEYFDKLGSEYFPAINNEELTKVDLYRYDEAWEKDASVVATEYFTATASSHPSLPALASAKPNTLVIDLRLPSDFSRRRLPASLNTPHVAPETLSPFSNPTILSALWTRLEAAFSAPGPALDLALEQARASPAQQSGSRVLVVCYDGDSARVATSVLRAKGWAADSARGGFGPLAAELKSRGMALHEDDDARSPRAARSRAQSRAQSAATSERGSGEQKQPQVLTVSPSLAGTGKRMSMLSMRSWWRRRSHGTAMANPVQQVQAS